MSKSLFNLNGLEVKEHDVVKLTNGMCVAICGDPFQEDEICENSYVTCITTPISSIHSFIFPRHIVEVVERFEDWSKCTHWFFENDYANNPLFVTIEELDKQM